MNLLIDRLLIRIRSLAEKIRLRMRHRSTGREFRKLRRSGEVPLRWIYFIPAWGDEPRATFADVWLLPENPDTKTDPLWITIDAMLAPSFADYATEHTGLNEMGDAPFHMDLARMHLVVRAHDFDEKECVDWIGRWLEASGLGFRKLVKGPEERFIALM